MKNEIFTLIPPTALADFLEVSAQRARYMAAHPDEGDNRARLNEALRQVRERIDDHLVSERLRCYYLYRFQPHQKWSLARNYPAGSEVIGPFGYSEALQERKKRNTATRQPK